MEKCMICEREVEPEEWVKNRTKANFIGEPIIIQGHAVCIGNVKKMIIIPNRELLRAVKRWAERMMDIMAEAELREAPTRGEV